MHVFSPSVTDRPCDFYPEVNSSCDHGVFLLRDSFYGFAQPLALACGVLLTLSPQHVNVPAQRFQWTILAEKGTLLFESKDLVVLLAPFPPIFMLTAQSPGSLFPKCPALVFSPARSHFCLRLESLAGIPLFFGPPIGRAI